MWHSIRACLYLYLVKLVVQTEGITYLKGIPTAKWTTRMIPLSKWLEDNNWRLAPYGNHEFTKIFKQYKPVILAKYLEVAPANITDTSLAKYVMSLFFTSTQPITKKLLKKDKIRLGKMKLVKENLDHLEAKLGLTTLPPPTTTEPPTEPYTGPSTRKTAMSFFDPDYIFDPNWPLKQIKRLKRDVSNRLVTPSMNEIQHEVGNEHQNQDPSLNLLWIKLMRNEFGMNPLNTKNTHEKKINRFKREVNNIIESQSHEKRVLQKRDLGSIVRRSTKRPHLSRNFKAQSMKRYKQDLHLATMLQDLAANITICPELLNFKRAMDDCKKNNLSTLFYVYNNVAYFGSVPPHVLPTQAANVTAKSKAVTYELGATKIISGDIFGDEKKKQHPKVAPGDVDIPNINIEPEQVETTIKTIEKEEVTEITDTTKLKRTRKKKTADKNETSSDTTKKTRAKRKTTKPVEDSLENNSKVNSETENASSQGKSKKRKVRSVDVASQNLVVNMLPTLLYFVHNNMHLQIRRKRNADELNDKTNKLEDKGETSNLGHFGKLKESIKRSKSNFVSYVKDKKDSFLDMPRKARYIAREMFLDGKFFVQELKEVPDRMKQDFKEKKEMFNLIWDMFKIFMPATEVGEQGGTTPETKVVNDPKQYVKNPEDYLTPDLSDLQGTTKIRDDKKAETLNEITTTKLFRTTSKTEPRTEMSTTLAKTERHVETTTTHVPTTTTIKLTTRTHAPIETSTTPVITRAPVTQEIKTAKQYASEPVLVTDPTTERIYHTKVLGPDYVPTNTRFVEDSSPTPTSIYDRVAQNINDENTFDKLSKSMKDKQFMDSLIKHTDADRLRNVMGNVNPGDIFKKMDDKAINRMGKLMAELDGDTIRSMQELALKTFVKPGGGSTLNPQNKLNKNK
uniref:Uncharacterized protein n=1 Tax=Cacopsylla melanoneura TaxID=428564 RepID=A0A8D8Y6J6_9HEMI